MEKGYEYVALSLFVLLVIAIILIAKLVKYVGVRDIKELPKGKVMVFGYVYLRTKKFVMVVRVNKDEVPEEGEEPFVAELNYIDHKYEPKIGTILYAGS